MIGKKKVDEEKRQPILVIRLGALGDLMFCLRSFQAIRAAHPEAEIALLTRAAFADLAEAMPWFDRVIVETHPQGTNISDWIKLRRAIKDFAPALVYDLQGKRRQTVLYALLGGPFGPAWSGAAPGCAFPRPWPPGPGMHFTDFLAAQLRAANVPEGPPPNVQWLDAQVGRFFLSAPYVVLVPGCSPKAPFKRWPATHYANLANRLHAQGLACVIVGSETDAAQAAIIKEAAPDSVDLSGQTTLFELAGIVRRAAGAIGNDTGPLHMAAALGVPTIALFSGRSDPVWSKPPGPRVAWRQSENLADLSVDDVLAAFESLLQKTEDEGG